MFPMNPGTDPLPSMASYPSRVILGVRVDATSYVDACQRVIAWAQQGESRTVCAANVHMVMEAYDDPAFREMVNAADLVTSDGMPLVWMLRRLGYPHQTRVYGPDLMLHVLRAAAQQDLSVGFYGSSPDVLQALITKTGERFPGLRVVYAYSPPYLPLRPEEDQSVVKEINATRPQILFVGLGCPKQERWMADHKGSVKAVMLGVGMAFDIHAGKVRQAPAWIQNLGLEWLFRLGKEPKRLWRRYLTFNPRFLVLAIMQLSGLRTFDA